MEYKKQNKQIFTPKNTVNEYQLKGYSGIVFIKEISSPIEQELFSTIAFLEKQTMLLNKLKRSKTEKFTMEQSRLLHDLYKHIYNAYHTSVHLGEGFDMVQFSPNSQGDSSD